MIQVYCILLPANQRDAEMSRRFPGWIRYGFPSVCFCLGTWQVYRMLWKNSLIAELEKGLSSPAVKLEAIPYVRPQFL